MHLKKIAVVPDSFKESLSAAEAARAIARGIGRVCPEVEIIEIPFADGGEGTVEAMVTATNGRFLKKTVKDPLGRPVEARFGLLGNGKTVVIEMAEASGLGLLLPEERNPMITSTFGTGELIQAALEEGVETIILGIGGSATNDLGTGMARALGIKFLDAAGCELAEGGAALAQLASIDTSARDKRLDAVNILVACDVDNPLVGKCGASCVYGPQKGANPKMAEQLDAALAHAENLMAKQLGCDILKMPGAGAAGGLGGGLVAFAGAKLRPGVEIIAEMLHLKERLADCDLVISGEGKMDSQSASGKAVMGVAQIAKAHDIPLVVLVGSIGKGAQEMTAHGVSAYFSLVDRPMDLQTAMSLAAEKLESLAEQVMRTLLLGSS